MPHAFLLQGGIKGVKLFPIHPDAVIRHADHHQAAFDRSCDRHFSGQSEKYHYDDNSNVSKRIDRKGSTFTYLYNNRDFLKSRSNANETITYDYDTSGRRLWMQDSGGKTSYTYNPTTRWLTDVTFPDQRTIQYEYNDQGKRKKMTNPFGIVTVYDYDSRNRLENVGPSENNPDASYQYKKNNQPLQTLLQNGVTTTFDYAALSASITQNKAGGALVNSYQYNYDLHGNQKAKTENGTMHPFSYDKLNRIDTSTQFNEVYSYDSRGNRLTLMSEKGIDLRGQTYQYDLDNRLTQIDTDNGTNVSYRYNGDGLLVERTEQGTTTRYYYDGSDIIAEGAVIGGIVTPKASYIQGNQLIARVDENGSKAYYVHNGHGDVVALLDGSGNKLNEYDYDIWGNPSTTQETIAQPFRYSGELWDETTGLQYLRARWYDPSMGAIY
ncbi:tRNA3(Ser)-specific nuclease WapA precursor [compost metagenome]